MKKKILNQEKLQKIWIKNLWIWKKINQRVRIVEDDRGEFVVQTREPKFNLFKKKWTEWDKQHNFRNLKNGIKKKTLLYRDDFNERIWC